MHKVTILLSGSDSFLDGVSRRFQN